jgi:hypothetical protein
MSAVKASRCAADRAITLAKMNRKSTWEAIIQKSGSKPILERPDRSSSSRSRRST